MGSICGSQNGGPSADEQNSAKENNSWIKNKESKIVIVGAGPAGVHMGSLLSKSGYNNVTILEKLDRIGGKSWTITDECGNPQEMGTCFTSPLGGFFDAIYDLFKEYCPDNKMVPLPDPNKGIFSSFKDKSRAEFKQYLYAQVEDVTTPEWLHFMPDILTGGINFIVAANKYCEIHKQIFGEYKYSTLPKPKDKALINMTMMAFLKANDLEGLIPLYLLVYSMFGFGSIKDIPAYYGLWWFKPQIVQAMVTLQNIVDPEPTTKITSQGFQQLWINIVKKHNINVKLGIDIKSINRNLENNGGGTIKIRYVENSNEEKKSEANTEEMECDVLFLACGNKIALNFLDATKQENEIFSCMSHFTLSTAFVDFKTNEVVSKEYVADNLYPKYLWSQDGHTVEFRMTQKRLKPDNYPNDKYGKDEKDRAIVKQFIGSEPNDESEKILENCRNEDLGQSGLNLTEIKQHAFQLWTYFPHFSIEQINQDYPWIIREEMQGKYNNTYYIGSSVCFESTKDVVEYNIQLKQQLGF